MITFTQYIRPKGLPLRVTIDRPEEIEQKAEEIARLGLAFEAEVLMTGEVSLTVADHEEGVDVGIQLCRNRPEEVKAAVDCLVETVWDRFCR